MKGVWLALGLVAVGSVFANVGCSDDSSGSGGSAGSGSTTTTTTSDTSSSSSATGTGGAGTTTSSSSAATGTGGGTGAYTTCAECSTDGAANTKECKTQHDACLANADCMKLYSYAYNSAALDKAGGCAVQAYITTNNVPTAAVNLYKAVDNCVYCMTCKTLCEPGSSEYCGVQNGTTTCP